MAWVFQEGDKFAMSVQPSESRYSERKMKIVLLAKPDLKSEVREHPARLCEVIDNGVYKSYIVSVNSVKLPLRDGAFYMFLDTQNGLDRVPPRFSRSELVFEIERLPDGNWGSSHVFAYEYGFSPVICSLEEA